MIPVQSSPCLAHSCAECCHDSEMPLLEEDVARLVKLGHDPEAFSRVDDSDGSLLLRGVEPAREDGKKPCYFLKDNRCSVYADRPAGCRIYPFVLTPERRMVRDEDCPHRREFKAEPALQRRLLKTAMQVSREAVARKR